VNAIFEKRAERLAVAKSTTNFSSKRAIKQRRHMSVFLVALDKVALPRAIRDSVDPMLLVVHFSDRMVMGVFCRRQ